MYSQLSELSFLVTFDQKLLPLLPLLLLLVSTLFVGVLPLTVVGTEALLSAGNGVASVAFGNLITTTFPSLFMPYSLVPLSLNLIAIIEELLSPNPAFAR